MEKDFKMNLQEHVKSLNISQLLNIKRQIENELEKKVRVEVIALVLQGKNDRAEAMINEYNLCGMGKPGLDYDLIIANAVNILNRSIKD